ncbi:MAG: hypothetical protein ACREJT_09920, partial [Myxococcota bacterium]
MLQRRALWVAVIAATFAGYGCQVIMASITSPSDSISGTGHAIAGVFNAISTSSGSGGGGSAKGDSYERDLREYTVMFMRSGGTQADFMRGVSRIAENHGIAH